MKLKDRVFEKQIKEVTVMVSDDVYGCDECQKEMAYNDCNLSITVFNNEGTGGDHQFCSWVCFAKFAHKIKSDYFVTLPPIQFSSDFDNTGCSVKDFLNILRPIK